MSQAGEMSTVEEEMPLDDEDKGHGLLLLVLHM
jgi:hypothetical protein